MFIGIGIAHTATTPTVDSLTNALEGVLQPDITTCAQSIADEFRTDGALPAAQRLLTTT